MIVMMVEDVEKVVKDGEKRGSWAKEQLFPLSLSQVEFDTKGS